MSKDTKNIKPNLKPFSRRTFQQEGKWIEKPRQSEVLECVCGDKYIKTRKGQKSCVRCIYRPRS